MIIQGDSRNIPLKDKSVNCVITSPPYWSLRKYDIPDTDWGDGYIGQLGVEPNPEWYINHLVQICGEIKRVLKDDGTFWLNIGDCYMSHGSISKEVGGFQGKAMRENPAYRDAQIIGKPPPMGLLKDKDLVGIPWMTAFALRADGWYLRSDIIWSKPNPMPESVIDRPSKSHEYIFLLTKSKNYFYDIDAVREPHTQAIKDGIEPTAEWRPKRETKGKVQSADSNEIKFLNQGGTVNRNPSYYGNPKGRNLRTVWEITTQPYGEAHFATFPTRLVEPCIKAGCPQDGIVFDPFAGSGTVVEVAKSLKRVGIGMDMGYQSLSYDRTQAVQEVWV